MLLNHKYFIFTEASSPCRHYYGLDGVNANQQWGRADQALHVFSVSSAQALFLSLWSIGLDHNVVYSTWFCNIALWGKFLCFSRCRLALARFSLSPLEKMTEVWWESHWSMNLLMVWSKCRLSRAPHYCRHWLCFRPIHLDDAHIGLVPWFW
jgi:hypothetical protein